MRFRHLNLVLLPLIIALQALFFVHFSTVRLIARDEGFYLIASQLVMHGKSLYLDFFYPQMPLLPYVYGLWMKFTSFSWESGRLLSALCAVLVGTLLYLYLKRLWGIAWALAGLALYLSSDLVFAWYMVAKSYALCTAFLMGAFLFLFWPRSREHRYEYIWIAAAGVMMACVTGVRLYLVVAAPCLFGAYLYFERDVRSIFQRDALYAVCYFSAGFAIGSFPALVYFALDPHRFWFNNIGYHLIRSELSGYEMLSQKLQVLGAISGAVPTLRMQSIQAPILFAFSVWHAVFCVMQRKAPHPALWMLLPIFLVSFVPTPMYTQYLAPLVPFALMLVLDAGRAFLHWSSSRSRVLRTCTVVSIAAVSAAWMLYVPSDLKRFGGSGHGIIGITKQMPAKEWNVPVMQEISQRINELTTPDDVVASQWPGYFVGAHAKLYPGVENQFGFIGAKALDAKTRADYHILTEDDFLQALLNSSIKLLVMHPNAVRRKYTAILHDGGFRLVDHFGHIQIFLRDGIKP